MAGIATITGFGARPDSDPQMNPQVNHAAVLAAVSAVGPGGEVHIPPGLFHVHTTLHLPPNVYLVGSGMRGSGLFLTDPTVDLLCVNVGTGLEKTTFYARDLLLMAMPGGHGAIVHTDHLSLVGLTRCQFKNGAFGVLLENGMNVTITDCIANEQSGEGVEGTGGFAFYRIRIGHLIGNLATEQHANAPGYCFRDCDHMLVSACAATDTYNDSGFKVSDYGWSGERGILFDGCLARGCGSNGAAPASGFELQYAAQVSLTGCRSMGNGMHGYYVRRSKDVTMAGCQGISNGKHGNGSGLYALDTESLVVSGSRFTDPKAPKTQQHGIEGAGTTDGMAITGNDLRGNAGVGLVLCGPNSVQGCNVMV